MKPTNMLRDLARHLMLDRQAERWLTAIDPTWSLAEPRARIARVIDETPDVKTFVLSPGPRWRGHRAGQYAVIEVEIDGVRVRRCYSLSSAPGDRPAITVKKIPGGRVSGWLHDRIRQGDVLGLGPAQGDFVLPDGPPNSLLLYSGGSGITPVMSILRDLDRRDLVGDIVFVHHARSRRDIPFARELDRIAQRRPGLRIVYRIDDELAGAPPFDAGWLRHTIPDFAERPTYLCGPAGLMAAVEQTWRDAGADGNLRREQFTAAPAVVTATDLGRARVTLRGGRAFDLDRSRPLLESLERAGERPEHGCRMGICNSCACRKKRGAVRNLTTGDISTEPDEEIRLCVSAPASDLELDL